MYLLEVYQRFRGSEMTLKKIKERALGGNAPISEVEITKLCQELLYAKTEIKELKKEINDFYNMSEDQMGE